MYRRFIVLAACIAAARSARAQEPPTPPPPPPPAPAPAPGSDSAEQANKQLEKDASSTVEAIQTRPQVVAVRNGTLGLPSPSATEGFQAAVDTQPLSSDSGVDAFTKVGGLQLTKDFTVDIVGEIHKQDVPRVVFDGMQPLPKMFTATIQGVGFRIAFFQRRRLIAAQEKVDLHNAMASKAEDAGALLARYSRCNDAVPATQLLKELNTNPAVADTLCRAGSGSRFIGGARFLVRASPEDEDGGKDSIGAAWELMYQYDSQKVTIDWSGFLGVSGTHFNDTRDVAGTQDVRFLHVNEARLSAGLEFRGIGTRVGTTDIAPAGGVYVTASRNYWTDVNTMPFQKVRGLEIEGGFYASGHFLGGFHGMIEFSIVRPYAHADNYEFVISVIPSVGSGDVLGKSKENK